MAIRASLGGHSPNPCSQEFYQGIFGSRRSSSEIWQEGGLPNLVGSYPVRDTKGAGDAIADRRPFRSFLSFPSNFSYSPPFLLVFAETDDCELDAERLTISCFLCLGLCDTRPSSHTKNSTYTLKDQLVVMPDFVHIC
jgi:hypothetical protein